ncbi:MAG TPA: hypothetical protein ENF73_01480 [Proteobacteria bacterium]|nr:hypothetical protein [Pseudomonadota bacterium]
MAGDSALEMFLTPLVGVLFVALAIYLVNRIRWYHLVLGLLVIYCLVLSSLGLCFISYPLLGHLDLLDTNWSLLPVIVGPVILCCVLSLLLLRDRSSSPQT